MEFHYLLICYENHTIETNQIENMDGQDGDKDRKVTFFLIFYLKNIERSDQYKNKVLS